MLDMIQRDGPLECDPGVIRLFGAADIGSRGMARGWSEPEEGHIWNNGPAAVCTVAVRLPVFRLGLVVLGEPYVTRARPVQDITMYGNGHILDIRRLTERTEVALEVDLEPEWWFERDSVATMTLLFHMPNSARPKELKDGQDGRELGFCFRSICLRPLHS